MVDTSINKTDRPNGLRNSNHKNVTTQRVSCKVAKRNKGSVELIMNDDTTDAPMNTEIEPRGVVCGKVPEIRPVKSLSFVTKKVSKQ